MRDVELERRSRHEGKVGTDADFVVITIRASESDSEARVSFRDVWRPVGEIRDACVTRKPLFVAAKWQSLGGRSESIRARLIAHRVAPVDLNVVEEQMGRVSAEPSG